MAAPRRRLAVLGAVAALCLGVLVTRVAVEGRGALTRGDQAAARGEQREAVRWWRHAARWHLPAAPWVERAYAQLEAAASAAEAGGDGALALDAWRSVRGAVLATRGLWSSGEDLQRLERADRRIAVLMAASEGSGSAGEAWHHERLAESAARAPVVGWVLLALAGLALWIGGAFWFALCGVTAENALRPQVAARAGVVVLVGLLVWMSGLYWA